MRVEQLARDALGREVRADDSEISRNLMLGELLERESPDRHDGVLIAARAARREEFGGALT